MAIDYVFEGTPPSAVPHDPATGLDNASNVFYVSSKRAGWVPVGGGQFGGAVVQASSSKANTTVGNVVTIAALGQVMYAVSLYMETSGTSGSGHTIVATLTWTSPVSGHTEATTMALDGGTSVVVETFPILCAANTSITMTFAYGGGATNDPYTYSVRMVAMP